MTSPLFPCPGCHRHVRVGGSRCPFCAAALPSEPEGLVPSAPPGSLSRAALFAFATTVAACSSPQTPAQTGTTQEATTASTTTTTPTQGGAVVETPPAEGATVAAAYGAAPPRDTAIAPIYGGPAMMIDAGPAADATVADAPATDVATVDAATDAARRDARVQPTPPRPDHGAIMVRYGAPPADFA